MFMCYVGSFELTGYYPNPIPKSNIPGKRRAKPIRRDK
jgi:hypothetical protein